MYYFVYDASGRLRFESSSWPMARAALDFVISEVPEPAETEDCPRLEICSEKGRAEQ